MGSVGWGSPSLLPLLLARGEGWWTFPHFRAIELLGVGMAQSVADAVPGLGVAA